MYGEIIPKIDVQIMLENLKVTIIKEQQSGVIDMSVIKKELDQIIQRVLDY